MIELRGLTHRYGSFIALDQLSLKVPKGDLHGFVGPNGAGKTTTMRILATLLKPTSGQALVDGSDVALHPRDVRRVVGYMPDFFGVYDRLKTWEYLDFYARCYGFDAWKRRCTIDGMLELVGLTDKRDNYVDELSRGMKQRLCLARALIHDPALLLLDEPASGMDPRARSEMKTILRTLKSLGKTVLISSHILPELSEMCDSLTIIDHGRLVFSGTVEALGQRMSGNAPLSVQLLQQAAAETMDTAERLLREFPGVTGVSREPDHVFHVSFTGDPTQAAALLRSLINAGLPLADFHRAPVNLEKVFMEVTQHE